MKRSRGRDQPAETLSLLQIDPSGVRYGTLSDTQIPEQLFPAVSEFVNVKSFRCPHRPHRARCSSVNNEMAMGLCAGNVKFRFGFFTPVQEQRYFGLFLYFRTVRHNENKRSRSEMHSTNPNGTPLRPQSAAPSRFSCLAARKSSSKCANGPPSCIGCTGGQRSCFIIRKGHNRDVSKLWTFSASYM